MTQVARKSRAKPAPPPPPFKGVGGGGAVCRASGIGVEQTKGGEMTKKAAKVKARKSTAVKPGAAAEVRPEPNGWQKDAFKAALERQAGFQEPAVVSMEGTVIRSPHSDDAGFTAMMSSALGSRSGDWSLLAMNWLTNAARGRKQQPGPQLETQSNAALAFMSDIAPENTVEAALALQMFATHSVTMEMLERTKQTDDRQALAEFANIATKMSRTFTTQMETMAKLRRGGEQVVKYIHVHEGGQAVVAGTINQGGRVNGKGGGQPQGQVADASLAALRSPDAATEGVPIACDAEREMLHTRREEHGRS